MSRGKYGKALEVTLEETNEAYRDAKILRCDKVAVPIKVIRTKFGRIKDAVFCDKSQLDFKGVFRSVSFSYDAKESETGRLPLGNIKPHQVEYMRDVVKYGEITFLIYHDLKNDEYYLIESDVVINKYDDWIELKRVGKRASGGSGSISTKEMISITIRRGIIDYLSYLNKQIERR